MQTTSWTTIFAAWTLVSTALTAVSAQAREVRQGIQVEITAEGLRLVSDEVRDQIGNSLSDIPVPDIEDTIDGGIDVSLSGVHASMALDSLALKPARGGLALQVALRDIEVTIEEFQLQKRVLGVNISSTCHNTTLKIGTDGAVSLNGVLATTVQDDNIRLATQDLTFPIGYGDYTARGPATCNGVWGVRDVTRLFMSGILKTLWPFVESMVTSRIASAIPGVEAMLNEQAHLSAMFDLKDMPRLPDRVAELEAFPTNITANDEIFRIEVGFRIRVIEEESGRLPMRESRALAAVRLASVGINPALLSETMAELFPHGTDSVELTGDMVPTLGDILKVRSLAGIWPDLNRAPLTDDKMRLFARLLAPPTLAADEATQAITTRIPRIELRFLAPIAGQWIDYFVVELDLEAGVKPTVAGSELRLGLLDNYKIDIQGRWADGYTPDVALFEKDLLGVIVSTLFDYAREEGPLARMRVPELEVRGEAVTLGNPHVSAPYLRIDALAPAR